MFNKDVPLKPFIFLDSTNEIIEEKGNQYTAIRKVQWVKEGDEPDSEKGKLEIRRWVIQKDGTELASKGVVFMTNDGPNQLTEILVRNNFGNTKSLLKSLIDRPDFKESVENLDKDEEINNGDYFDMRDMLLSYSDEDKGESDE